MSKELADRIVALKIIESHENCYYIPEEDDFGAERKLYFSDRFVTAEQAVNDGRVVLALMQRLNPNQLTLVLTRLISSIESRDYRVKGEQIAEYCCDTLEQANDK